MKLTDKELHHLDTVIRYLHSDELKDYENEGRPPDHIFTSVLGLQEILRRETPAPQPSKLAEEVASRPGDWAKDMAPPAKEVARGPSVVDRGSREIELRWAKETIGLVAVELNEAYAQFDITRDNGSIPSGALNQASRRLEEAMQHLGLTDEIPF